MNQFEEMFGPQEEWPIGNRDKDIDEAISQLKKEGDFPESIGINNQMYIALKTQEKIGHKYGFDFNPIFGDDEQLVEKANQRVKRFLSIYDLDSIVNRLTAPKSTE